MPANSRAKWAALTALMVVGAASLSRGQSISTKNPQTADAQQQSGRYQIFVNPNIRADTFLIDTQTGKTWVATHFTDVENEPTIWLFRERVDDAQEYLLWIHRQTAKKTP